MFDKLHVVYIISFIHIVSIFYLFIFPLNLVEVYLSNYLFIYVFIYLFIYRINHFN